jgi:hypothetical protein
MPTTGLPDALYVWTRPRLDLVLPVSARAGDGSPSVMVVFLQELV